MVAANQQDNVLRLLFWETTAGCNLECVHCRRLDVSRQLMANDLATEQALQFVRELAAFARPILVLSGGEPLFRPDIFEIAAGARDCGLPVALATNGTLITEPVARRIVDSGIRRVAISIDGADATTHDTFRRQPGSLAAALRGFGYLRELKMSLQINCTVTRHNVHQLDALYAMARDRGADALHLFMLVPVGCGVQIAESNMLPATEYERVLNWMYDKSQLDQLQLKATCAPHYFRVMHQRRAEERKAKSEERTPHGLRSEVRDPRSEVRDPRSEVRDPPARTSQAAPRREPLGHGEDSRLETRDPRHAGMAAMTKGCLAGSAICFVSHTGEVFPCGYLPVSAGNVRQRPISDIWANAEVFARLRDVEQLEGKCGRCEFKRVCLGCRARAFYETHGNYLAEEPFCVYEPRSNQDG